jgi:BirA family biotin operon repressor/biotin-[acetyl-CoA-carboxylase] ligase
MMPLNLDRIQSAGLVASIDYHDSLPSTSDRALELAALGDIELPLLVLTERQMAGRGRGTNRWWTSEGALTFSLALVALPDQLPPERWPQTALVAGLAVCEAIKSLLPSADVRVKWPNDVYLAGRKLGGILSESVPGWRDRLVVGIGLNVNNSMQTSQSSTDQAAADLNRIATALIDHDSLPRDLTATLLAILDHWDRRWHELLHDGFAPLADEYRRLCFLSGKTTTIHQPGEHSIVGLCRGIDDLGALRLQTEGGECRVLSGTVASW